MDRRQGGDDDQGVEGDQQVGARGEQDGQPAWYGCVPGLGSLDSRVGPGSGRGIEGSSLVDDRVSPAYVRGRREVRRELGARRPPSSRCSASSTSSAAAVGGVREGRGETKVRTWTQTCCRWRAHGDEDAFGELVAPYRHELQVHCYRILGSLQDAEDVLQETLLSAWRGLDGFEGRSSVRTWLYRIATNRSLDAVRASARRDEPVTTRINGLVPPAPDPPRRGPVAARRTPTTCSTCPTRRPARRPWWRSREATSLAFVTALQLLPPRQRAVLILRDVLGYRAAEAADVLDTTVESVTSALKRARATLDSDETLAERRTQPPAPGRGLAGGARA